MKAIENQLSRRLTLLFILFAALYAGANAQNKALHFDGAINNYDYLSVPYNNSLDFTNSFTLEAWINFDQVNVSNSGYGWRALFAKGSYNTGYGLMIYAPAGGSRVIRFYHEGLTATSTGFAAASTGYSWPTINPNQWYHVAVTYDGSEAAIYLDGVKVASQAVTGNIAQNTNDLNIGFSQLGIYPWDGIMDEVRVWNVARTESEINAAKDLEMTGVESGLVLNYSFNEGKPLKNNTALAAVTDNTVNGNDGSFVGFGLTGTAGNYVSDTPIITPDASLTFGAGALLNDTIRIDIERGSAAIGYLLIDNAGAPTLNWSMALSDTLGFGKPVSFNKANFASWQLPENQDRITGNVYITRGDIKSIFNARTEITSANSVSPADTEWFRGGANKATSLAPFHTMHGGNPGSLVGDTATIHLITDNEYHEVVFSSFSGGNTGGGFAYTRTPMHDYISATGPTSGTIASGGSVNTEVTFDATNLNSGLNYGTLTFTTDDPANPTVTVVTELTVLGPASFNLSEAIVGDTVAVADAATTKTFKIFNTGASELNWSTTTAGRPGQMNQVTLDALSGTIVAGGEATITVTFDATISGNFEWPVTFTTNDPSNPNPMMTISMRSTGVPVALINPTSLDFEDTFVGYQSSTSITLINTGTDTLFVTNIATDQPSVTLSVDSLAIPSGIQNLEVSFAPSVAGAANGNLTFTTNDPTKVSNTIPFTALALDPPVIDVSPLSITQSLTVNDTVTTQVTVNNTGGSDLNWNVATTLDAPLFVKSAPVNFVASSAGLDPDVISPNVSLVRGSCAGFASEIYNQVEYTTECAYQEESNTLRWSPKSTQESTDADYSNNLKTVRNSLGSSFVGSTISLHLVTENRYFDLEILTYDLITGALKGFSYNRTEILPGLGTTVSSGTATAGGNILFDVEFYGGALVEGTFTGSYTVSSNDPLAPSLVLPISVTVTGGTPNVSTTTGSAAAAATQVNQTNDFSLEIINTGNAPLNVSDINVDDPAFAVGTTSFIVPAAESYILPLSFTPTLVQPYSATLSIVSDDPVNSPFDVTLTGNGIASPEFQLASVLIQDTLAAGVTNVKMIQLINNAAGDLEWSIAGEVAFEKADNANPNLEASQDRISNMVWLTRGDNRPTYNYLEFTTYVQAHSSILFGNGTTFSQPIYGTFDAIFNGGADGQVGNTTSLYLVEEDRYFDLAYSKWTSGGGGGFAYTRREAVPWLELGSFSGTISGTGQTDVTATFKTNSLSAGDYEFTYDIATNDPVNPLQTVTFQLHVTGKPDINVTFASDSVRFGDVNIGQTVTLPVTVSNVGDSTLSVTNIVFDDAAFGIDQTNFIVEAGNSLVLNASFTPTAATTYKAGFTITSNSPGESPIEFGIRGTGIDGPNLNTDVATINLQTVVGGFASADLTLSNGGQQTVNWSLASKYINGSEVTFTREANVDWALPQNQDRIAENVWITRENSGSLFNQFTGNNSFMEWADNKTVISGPLPTYEASLSDAFGGGSSMSSIPGNTVSLHLTEQDRYFDVRFNSWANGGGSGNGSGGGFSYTRTELATWLSLSKVFGSIVVSGADDVLTISADAAGLEAGTYTVNLVLSSDGVEPEQTVAVNLTVIGAPQIAVTQAALDFGNVVTSTESTVELEIKNNGNSTLNISDLSIDNPVFTVSNSPLAIAPGATTLVPVSFSTSVAQSYTGTLTISNDDSTNPTLAVSLSGVAIEPPTALVDMVELTESLFLGSSSTQTFTIQNTGSTELMWSLGADQTETIFAKADFVDVTLAENQDQITNNVILTRGNVDDLFNIAVESSDVGTTPGGTKWTLGASSEATFSNYGNLDFITIPTGAIETILGQTISLYSEADQQYFDVIFTSYTSENVNGGGFEYSRRAAIGPKYDAVTFSASNGVIAPGASQQVTVEFNPLGTYAGIFELPLQVVSNDPVNPRIDIPLSLSINGIVVNTPIADQLEQSGFASSVFDITGMFTDAQGDALTISVSSSDPSVVTVNELSDMVTVTEAGASGTSVISITADDGKGTTETFEFDFRVNAAPTVTSAIGNQAYENAFGAANFDLSTVFSDADGDALSYSIMTDASGIVSATETGGILILTEQGPGTVNVTVTANDGFGGTVQEVFEVFVNKINQTITFNVLTAMTYGDAAFNVSGTASSSLTVDYGSSDLSVATVSGNTITIVGAGTTTITASQAGNATYNAAIDVQQVLTVNQASLTATANDANRTYGATNPSLSLSYAGFVNGEDASVLDTAPSASTTADATSNVGTYAITASGGSDNNYAFSYMEGTLTVSQATLTATADNQTINKGDALPTFTVSYTGFVNEDDASVLDTPPTAGVSINDSSAPGTYDITVSGGTDANYGFTYQSGTLTINNVLGLLNENDIQVYPNPVVDYLTVSSDEVSSIEIFDLRGTRVLSKSVEGKVDLSSLETGSFIIQLQDAEGKVIYSGRIIKN